MASKKWVKNIQTAGYNGARTVYVLQFNYNNFFLDDELNGDELKLLSESEDQNGGQSNGFIGPINLVDDPIPDVMIKGKNLCAFLSHSLRL